MIGYGHFNVTKDESKKFVMMYALVGLYVFADTAVGTYHLMQKAWDKSKIKGLSTRALRRRLTLKQLKVVPSHIIVGTLALMFLVFGSTLFYVAESGGSGIPEDDFSSSLVSWANKGGYKTRGWTFFDAFWFTFISSTTIGFGDMTPDWNNKLICVIELIVITIGIFVMGWFNSSCVNAVSKIAQQWMSVTTLTKQPPLESLDKKPSSQAKISTNKTVARMKLNRNRKMII